MGWGLVVWQGHVGLQPIVGSQRSRRLEGEGRWAVGGFFRRIEPRQRLVWKAGLVSDVCWAWMRWLEKVPNSRTERNKDNERIRPFVRARQRVGECE